LAKGEERLVEEVKFFACVHGVVGKIVHCSWRWRKIGGK
jgi:hypothetical protein